MIEDYKTTITKAYPKLSDSERLVADYALSNIESFIRMPIKDIKNAVGVSEPTVMRFCRSLGFSGFTDFKISVAQSINPFRKALHQNTSEGSSSRFSKVLKTEIDILETTMKLTDEKLVDAAADKIMAANRICFFGVNTSAEICADACRKILRLGKSAWNFSDEHEALNLLSTFTEKDLVVLVSYSGQTREVLNIINLTKTKNIQSILLSGFPSEKLQNQCDIVLRTFSQEIPEARLAIFSRVGQFAMFDAIFFTLISKLGDSVADKWQQTFSDLQIIK